MKRGNLSAKDIAKLAGVSVATVSRVINQNGRFSKETEKRVLEIIKEYEYKPDLVARGLRTNKLQSIGIIVPDITNTFFASVALVVQKKLLEYNYSSIICNTDELESLEQRHLTMLEALRVSGVIYITGGTLDVCHMLDLPTVYIDRKPLFTKDNIVCIESDNMQGGYLAGKELIQNGCTKIAVIEYKKDISTHVQRVEGCRKALEKSGLTLTKNFIKNVDEVNVKSGYNATRELFSECSDIDGIFCTSDILAIGALKAMEERGLKIPQQVKLVGFDNIPITEMVKLPITTVQQPVTDLGEMSVKILLDMVKGKMPGKNQYVLPVTLISRYTTNGNK